MAAVLRETVPVLPVRRDEDPSEVVWQPATATDRRTASAGP
jgi:hypothetical protein